MYYIVSKEKYALTLMVWLLINLSLSRAYVAIAVNGTYPTVLPRPSSQHAVGYDKTTNTILLYGGDSRKQGVTFNDEKFNDLGTDYMPINAYGGNYYTMVGNDLWTINGGGTSFIIIDTVTRSIHTPSTEFPQTVSPHSCLASHNNYLFVVGGWNPIPSQHMMHDVQIYDIHNDEWIDAPLMQESRAVCGCIVNNNRLYVIAGLLSNSTEYIDISGDLWNNIKQREWQYVEDRLSTTLRALTVVNYGDKILILGGRQDVGTDPIYLLDIPVIHTSTNTISIEGSLSYSVLLAGCIVVRNRVYIFGGQDNTGSSVDSYQYIDLPEMAESESTGIHVVSVLLIIFFVIIFLYCVGGYIFNGCKSQKWGDVTSNLPHISFWRKVPYWILAGFKVVFCCQTGKDDKIAFIKTDQHPDTIN